MRVTMTPLKMSYWDLPSEIIFLNLLEFDSIVLLFAHFHDPDKLLHT